MNDNERKQMGKKGVVLQGQTRECIANVIEFMKREAEAVRENGKPLIPLTNFKQRVLAATGISHGTYQSISQEAANVSSGRVPSFQTPGTTRKRKRKSEINVVKVQAHVIDTSLYDYSEIKIEEDDLEAKWKDLDDVESP